MIKVAIIDDEMLMVDFIHKNVSEILNELKVQYEIADFTDSAEALNNVLNSKFDIVFLDIDMPEISGSDIAKQICIQEKNTAIVFVSNKDELVYDVIKYAPFRFIRKSRFKDEIHEAIFKYIDRINNNKSIYMFSTPNGKIAVNLTKVRYVEVSSHKLYIYEINNTIVTNGNLKDIEETFFKFGFIKTHQSYLVNYRFINLIKRNEVILDDGTSLPLSRSKYENTKIEYMHLSRRDSI